MRKPPASRITASIVAGSAACSCSRRKRLGVVRPRHAVDDEARRGLRVHRLLAPGQRGVVRGCGHGGVGRQAADHFHQRHQRRRVEEVHADDAAGVLQPGRDRGHRNRRGIGGEDAVWRDDAFQFGEQLPRLTSSRSTMASTTSAAQPARLARPRRSAARRPRRRLRRSACPFPPACRRSNGCARWPLLRRPAAHRAAAPGARPGRRSARCRRPWRRRRSPRPRRPWTVPVPWPQAPTKRGARLSMNAATPSR